MTEPLTFSWLAELVHVARGKRLGVLTDVDGTISYIAPRPDLARVEPAAREALAALLPLVTVVGAVSGRELEDVRMLVGLPDLLYSGGHGMRLWHGGVEEAAEGAEPFAELAGRLAAEIAPSLTRRAVRIEQKKYGVAVHYRDDPEPVAARAAVLAAVRASPSASWFSLRDGARVVELVPPLGVSKATAIRRIVERFRLDALLFFGDDITDLDAFAALHELRARGQLAGVGVASIHGETPAAVREIADAAVPAVVGVTAALQALRAALEAAPEHIVTSGPSGPETGAPASP